MGKQSKKKHNFLTAAHQTLRKKGVVTTVYLVLRLLVILVMVPPFVCWMDGNGGAGPAWHIPA